MTDTTQPGSVYAALAPILSAAVSTNSPMSAPALAAACALAGGHGISPLRLYSRPDLPAHLAADLWDQHLPKRNGARPWMAARLLRPECEVPTGTVADVQALSMEAAAGLAECPHHAVAVDPALLSRLTHYPVLRVATAAAVAAGRHECPGCQTGSGCLSRPDVLPPLDSPGDVCPAVSADRLVDQLGQLAQDTFGNVVGALPVAGDDHRLIEALSRVTSPAAPVRMRERAALTWTAPVSLARVDLEGLSVQALTRIARRYVIPSVPVAGKGLAARLVNTTIEMMAVVPQDVVAELGEVWQDNPDTVAKLGQTTRVGLWNAFGGKGVALVIPARDRAVSDMPSHTVEQLDLFQLIDESGSELVWRAVAAAAADGSTVTWAELTKAASAAVTA